MAKKTIVVLLIFAVVMTPILLFSNIIAPNEDAFALALKVGSTGSEVKQVQQKLKRWGYYSGSVDGIFGSGTKKAVVAFQKKNGLSADGIVGTKTFQALGIQVNNQTNSGGTTSNDTYLLAKCIYAEARGEPYLGQVAIAAVVLNRVRSSSFPNTISGVIYQPWAFTAVNDGQINLSPNDSAMRAAKDALSGWDPTYGSLYYYNPRTATNAWIKKKEIHLSIGKHVFCL